MTTSFRARLVLFAAMVATIGCDRVSKHVATVELYGEPRRSYLADTIRLQYVENPGGFLGLGAEFPTAVRTAIFSIGTAVMLLALIGAAVRYKWQGWLAFGCCLIVSGGVSNWVDRVLTGSVVDFMNVGLGSVRTGIFNVADSAIMAGVALLVLAEARKPSSRPNE